jgi:hypothetical protein
MNKNRIGKSLLTFVLIGGAVLSFALDWSSNHLLNPLWHPHGRYHSAVPLRGSSERCDVATLANICGAWCRLHRGGARFVGLLDTFLLCAVLLAGSLLLGGQTWA